MESASPWDSPECQDQGGLLDGEEGGRGKRAGIQRFIATARRI